MAILLKKHKSDINAIAYFINQLANMRDGIVKTALKDDIQGALERLEQARKLAAKTGINDQSKNASTDTIETLKRTMAPAVKHKVVDKVHSGSQSMWMPAAIPREGKLLSRDIKIPLSKDQVDEIDTRFQSYVDQYHQDLHIQQVTRKYNKSNISDLQSGRRSVEYFFETDDEVKIPPLTKEESKRQAGEGYTIATYMDMKKITTENRQRAIYVLAIHAKSYIGSDNDEMTIFNIHDDDFIVDLAIQMKRLGIHPILDSHFDNREALIRRIDETSDMEGKDARLPTTRK